MAVVYILYGLVEGAAHPGLSFVVCRPKRITKFVWRDMLSVIPVILLLRLVGVHAITLFIMLAFKELTKFLKLLKNW